MTDGYYCVSSSSSSLAAAVAAADLSLNVLLLLGTHEITDSTKLEHIQRKFTALATVDSFQTTQYYCHNLLEKLNLQTLLIRHHHSDILFIMFIIVLNVAFLS
jgi:hypothetical protein